MMTQQHTSSRNKWGLMIKDKTFYITYFATKHKAFITRKAKWTDDCKMHTAIGPKSVDRRLLEASSPLDINLRL